MPEPFFTVQQVAEHIGVTDTTVRNWSRRYASHLSEHAAPSTGTERQFTMHDVNVLRFVASSVADKRSHADIEHNLASTTFPTVLESLETTEIASRSSTASDAPIAPYSATSTPDYAPVLADLAVLVDRRHDETVRRLDRLERQRHGVVMLAAGIIIGVTLMLLAMAALRMM